MRPENPSESLSAGSAGSRGRRENTSPVRGGAAATRTSGGEDDPFAVTLRTAVRERGLSLERVRYHLARRGHDVSAATLSYWQSGRSRPERATSVAALGDLEVVLEVAPGTLTDALGKSRGRPVALPSSRRSRGVAPPSAGLTRDKREVAAFVAARDVVAARMGLHFRNVPSRVSVHVRAQVRPDRTLGRRSVREVVWAPHNGFSRFPVGLYVPGAAGDVQVIADRNCRIAQVARSTRHPDLVVAVIERETPLLQDEPWLLEYRVEPLDDDEGTAVFVHLDGRTELCVFDVEFARGDQPVALTFTSRREGRDKVASLPVAGERQSAAAHNVGPGLVGVGWWW